MTQKDFIVSVQKSCHLEHQQCAMLLNALSKLMAKAGVEQIPITLPGLGTFTSHKHPEYIKEDPESGQQTLYPPRISYRMQSEDKDVRHGMLEKQLAEDAKTSLEETSRFISALVQNILAVLKKGEEVEVKGIGSFRVINSNQGDIQRIAYTPDEQMKQQVNAPFNCFEPVAIKSNSDSVATSVGEKETEGKNPSIVVPPVQRKPTAAVDPISVNPVDGGTKPIKEQPAVEQSNSEPKEDKVTGFANKKDKKGKSVSTGDKSYDEELLKEIQRNNRMLFFILISLIVISLGALCKFLLFPDKEKEDPPVEVNQAPVEDVVPSSEITFDQKMAEELEAAARLAREDSIAKEKLRRQQYKKWSKRVANDTTANASAIASDTTVMTSVTKTAVKADSAAITDIEQVTVTEENKVQESMQENNPAEVVPSEKAPEVLPINTDSTQTAKPKVQATTATPVVNSDTIATNKK